MGQTIDQFKAGDRVKVVQQIPQRDGDCWMSETVGVIAGFGQKKTGSWYAHAKDERLWLDRLTLKLDDGEIVVCNLDRYTHVEMVDANVVNDPDKPDVVNTEIEGGEIMRAAGETTFRNDQGQGIPNTPSGDLGAPTEPK